MCRVRYAASSPGSRRAGAFTLIELLVVIGIIAVLVGILLPALRSARVAARNTLCASRLHDLTAACTSYLNEFRVYPRTPVVVMTGHPAPRFITFDLLNELAPYLDYPLLPTTTGLYGIPDIVQCPFAQANLDDPNMRGPIPLPGGSIMLTGYQYSARLDEVPAAFGGVIQPKRIPNAKGTHRGVIWSDDLAWYSGSGLAFVPGNTAVWGYMHLRDNVRYVFPGFDGTMALSGQHRAWTDGSVEWVPGEMIDTEISRRDMNAAFYSGTDAARAAYYWF